MLTVFSGPYHPHLERAFLERIQDLKLDPAAPLAVVAPSSRLLERLQLRLAQTHRAYMNIYFHTFATLAQKVAEDAGAIHKPVLSDPLFFDTLVKTILRNDRPFHEFTDMAIPDGFPSAVRATLRDLYDAGVVPQVVMEGVDEKFLGQPVDVGQLKELLRLYQIYVKRLDALPVQPRNALLREAAAQAPESKFLGRFKEIIYYGFYDATGLQTDFFQAVVKHHPASFFFPYDAENTRYAFAKRFRDIHLQGVMTEEIRFPVEPAQPEFEIVNVSGLREEAYFIAQQILSLRQNDKIPYHEIAVVARQRERLDAELPRVLDEYAIPFHSSTKRTFAQWPLFKTVMNAVEAEKALPPKGTWSEFAAAVRALLEPLESGQLKFGEALQSFADFELINKTVQRQDFLEALKDRLSALSVAGRPPMPTGVSLLHAEAARGLSFQAVFVIGVEDKVFPRIIREDPFLRDDARVALTNTFGHKIAQKFAAYEEEQLLFEMFTTAADQKLFLLYQRSDDDGRVVGPSSFVRDFAQRRGVSLETYAVNIARSYRARLKRIPPFAASRRDAVTTYLWNNDQPAAVGFAQAIGSDVTQLTRGLTALEALQSLGKPTAFDGLVDVDVSRREPLSASRMEIMGRCPFLFFAEKVLGLPEEQREASPSEFDSRVRGKLIHTFFESFYKNWQLGQAIDPLFETTFEGVFGRSSSEALKIHPVLWEALRISLKTDLRALIEKETPEFVASGYTPAHFEVELSGPLPPPLDQVRWTGKMDRIDLSPEGARVIDYKTGRFRAESVVSGALHGRTPQPPLYILLTERFLKERERKSTDVSFAYRFTEAPDEERGLDANEWNSNKKEILNTLQTEIEMMKKGQFPIIPDDYCHFCSMRTICRRNDSLSVHRSQSGPAEIIHRLRAKKPGKAT